MTTDRTEYQSTSQIREAKKLSLESTKPPAQIRGYSIQNMLGSGAFGEVWAGIDQKTGRRVAIKFYTRRSSLDVTLLASEVEKLVYLAADRYVVQLLDVGWDADPPYYVMDYIDNGSLEDELKRNKSFDVAEAVELFEEIGIGLMHLHGKGILHCDLKPGNVLLDRDLKPRLADFGQSRLSHEQSPALGTLYYMSPEQAATDAVPDARWDVYALGALLYTMLVGSPPYREEKLSSELESKTDLIQRLQHYRTELKNADKPTAHRQVPGVDRQLADIIDRCIAYDPKKRFASVQAVLLALKQREIAHARRPLYVLGVIGPLLFLLTLGAFGSKLHNDAIEQTDTAVTEKALESNEWVAKLAASNAGEQIDMYFRAVVQLAKEEKFQETFREVIENSELTPMRLELSDPNKNDEKKFPELKTIREKFVANATRKKLENELNEISKDPSYHSAASWFICDKNGTQLAAQFNDKIKSKTRGKNYSYRTYFSGLSRDRTDNEGIRKYPVEEELEKRPHIEQPHLSAVFQSTAVYTWKVAFSAPITIDGEFAGILAVTVELGSFVQFDNRSEHYVMLVDGREGDHTGIILEHPLFDAELKKAVKENGERRLPERFSDRNFHLTAEKLEENRSTNFIDPLGADSEGFLYRSRFLAAIAPVKRTCFGCELVQGDDGVEQDSELRETGMVVVAVEKYDLVTKPVQELASRLWWLSLSAVFTVIALALVLWLFLIRVIKNNRKRLQRSYSMSTESASLASSTIQSNRAVVSARSLKLSKTETAGKTVAAPRQDDSTESN